MARRALHRTSRIWTMGNLSCPNCSELFEFEFDSDSDKVIRPVRNIPKPSGEPGRPNSGGYSIEDALISWGKDEFGKVMVGNNTSLTICK